MNKIAKKRIVTVCTLTLMLGLPATRAHADSGNWTYDGTTAASLLWSEATSWSSNPTVPGTAAGDVITFTNNIAANRTVTINTDSRTVGALTIGDADNIQFFTLAASGGAGLILNNSGSGATITSTTTSATLTGSRDTISAPITLADNLGVSVAGGYFAITGAIGESDGVRSITKSGNGVLVLTGNNSYSGGFTLNAGTVQTLANANETVNPYTGFGTGTLTINGGTFGTRSSGSFTTTNNSAWNANFALYRGQTGTATWNHQGDITLGGNVSVTQPNNFFNLNVSGDIGETDGPRSLTFSIAAITLSGDNTHSGGTTLTAGTLNINSATALGLGTLTLTAGTIGNTSGNPVTIANTNAVSLNGNITFSGTNDLNLGTGTVTMNNNRTITVTTNTLTVGGEIAQLGGTRTLTKAGAGTLNLDGVNTYMGLTTVSAGALGGKGTIPGAVTVAAAGSLAPGSGGVGTLTINGALDISAMAGGAGKLVVELDAPAGANDHIGVGGTLTIGTGLLGLDDLDITDLGGMEPGASYTLISATAISGTLDDGNSKGTVAGHDNVSLKIVGNNLVLSVPAPSGTLIYFM